MAKANQKKEAKPKAIQKKVTKKAVKPKKQVKTRATKELVIAEKKRQAKAKVAKELSATDKKETKSGITEKEVGEITNYFEHVQAAAIKLESPLNAGDTIHIKGGEVDFEQRISSMQINRVPVSSANKGDEVGIRMNQQVRKGYKVYLK